MGKMCKKQNHIIFSGLKATQTWSNNYPKTHFTFMLFVEKQKGLTYVPLRTWALLHKTMVTLQLMVL